MSEINTHRSGHYAIGIPQRVESIGQNSAIVNTANLMA